MHARAAAASSRTHTGDTDIALSRTRFGALLQHDAAGAETVDALMLLAPPASGRTWLREMRAFQAMREGNGRKRLPIANGGEEAVGFLMTGPTLEALGTLDPLARAKVKNALLIARDDLPGGEERVAKKLEAQGATVTITKSPGYGAMMQDDPYKAEVPDAMWAECAEWLAARYPDLGALAPAPTYVHSTTVHDAKDSVALREEAVQFDGMFGVLTEPEGGSDLPAIVLHSIGANPHYGANRIYVRMARKWAAQGFRVLRFDLTGIADSPPRTGETENQPYSFHSVSDARCAMNFLSRARGVERFILMGLCSGAYVSYHAAVADPRVLGIVLMNLLAFTWKPGDSLELRTRKTVKSSHFYSKAIYDRAVWKRLIKGDIHVRAIALGLLEKAWARARRRAAEAVTREGEIAQGFRAILKRGGDVYFIFASEDGGRDLVDEHLGVDGEKFRREKRFRLDVVEGTDHTFAPLWSQDHLFDMITKHLATFVSGARSSRSMASSAQAPL
jgi:pimeloyl-ACP methyl ester carboxylesterase